MIEARVGEPLEAGTNLASGIETNVHDTFLIYLTVQQSTSWLPLPQSEIFLYSDSLSTLTLVEHRIGASLLLIATSAFGQSASK